MAAKKKITILSLGGTIAMVPSPSSGAGVQPKLSASDLLQAAPELAELADISAETLLQKGSANLKNTEIVALCQQAERIDADAIVVTQGTDTMEETAFLASLIYRGKAPLVFTGAMRSPTQPGADGRANLYAAALTGLSASAPKVCVVMNDEIHHPCYVVKAHTSNVAAFQSPIRGPIGQIAENSVHMHPVNSVQPFDVPRVFAPIALQSAVLDDDGALLGQVVDAGYQGLIVEAFGAGHVSENVAHQLAKVAKSIPVILSSRVRAGVVFERTYGYPGAEIDLLNRGLVPGGRLSGRKCRLLLSLLIGLGLPDWKEHFTAFVKQV